MHSQEIWGNKWCLLIDWLVVTYRENCTTGRMKRNVDLVYVIVVPLTITCLFVGQRSIKPAAEQGEIVLT